MALIIELVLGNWFIVALAVAVCTTIVKVRRGAPGNAAYAFWGELLFYVVGFGYVYTGILHAYFGPWVAPEIGWQPSPFEYELGWMEIPLGAVALMALWRGYEFRLATTIMYAVFAFGAAAQHLQLMLCCGNYSPGNAGLVLWVADIAIPIVAIVAAMLARSEQP